MSKSNLIASAGSRDVLEKMINDYFFSENWVICDDGRLFNKLKQSYSDGFVVKYAKKRWRFELVIN